MSEAVGTPSPESTPAAVAPAPAITEAAPASVASTEAASPAVTEAAPVSEIPAATEAAPAEAKIELHTDTPTLMEGLDGEKKPEEPKTEEGAKPPAEAAKPEPVTEPIVYDFKFPDEVKIEPDKLEPVMAMFRENNISPEAGQKLMDLYVAERVADAQNTLASQHKAFGDTRAQWRDQIMGDKELGGAGFQTASKAVARARDLLVPEADRTEFNDMLKITGVGDHPAFWRMLYRAANRFDEPIAPPEQRTPPPNQSGQRGNGFASLFNNPKRS